MHVLFIMALKMSPIFIWIICVVVHYSSSSICPGYEDAATAKAHTKGPTLALSKIGPPHFVSPTQTETIINATKTVNFDLECWANYPIDLTFSGHLVRARIAFKWSSVSKSKSIV